MGEVSPLAGRNVVVLGASSGIGLEVARQAAERGARVIMTARRRDKLEAAARDIEGDVHLETFDGFNRTENANFFEAQHRIDHLVSMIGDTANGTFLGLDEDRGRQVLDRKLWTQLFIVKTARSKMASDGSITLTGGTSDGRGTFSFDFAFSVLGNKALALLVDALSIELSPIRVNVVEPGLTSTALHDDMDPQTKEQVYARYKEMLLVHRIPTACEVARTYIHVMESGLLNGDRLRPDGGRAIGAF